MAIDLSLVKMAEVKAAIKGLNESGLLDAKIKMVGKAADLVQKFVDGLAECDKKGKLDEVPEDVFSYYGRIVPPKSEASTDTATKAPAAKKAPAAAGPPKATRASVFAKVIKRGKFTREQLAEKLDSEYRLNTKENKWWVGNYLNLLIELGAVQPDDKGRMVYGG